jgi:hypothetical protein
VRDNLAAEGPNGTDRGIIPVTSTEAPTDVTGWHCPCRPKATLNANARYVSAIYAV